MKRSRLALFQSLIALLLCFSMLVGTTFAWFTDGVSSSNNTIAAGSLDVELEYLDAEGNWTTVNGSTEVLDKSALWEPGYTEVAYLRITNAGDLALKYALGVGIINENGSINARGEKFFLSDHIRFGLIDSETQQTYASRTDAQNALTESKLIIEGVSAQKDLLEKGKMRYVTLVVYMPEDVDNIANYATGVTPPDIQLGIELIASQTESEADSFGTDYDTSAALSDFSFPVNRIECSTSGGVETEGDNTTKNGLTLENGQTTAFIPEGVLLDEGVDVLTLEVSSLERSEANITLNANEASRSLDVHVAGVSQDNTIPMEICIREAAAKGLNTGNLKLYHVENGETLAMTRIEAGESFTAHNQFKYDPATGDITLYLATFSEVALVADTVNAWEGEFDYTWYDANATVLTIANADQLAAFGQLVSEGTSFSGNTVKLINDVNMGGADYTKDGKLQFYPIGYTAEGYKGAFSGTFDGTGHKISNIYQNTWMLAGNYDKGYYNAAMGLFGYVHGGTVKNLTVNNFKSEGEYAPTGCVAAYAANATFENIAVTNSHPATYNTSVAAVVGRDGENGSSLIFRNITVDNSNEVEALWGSWDVGAAGILGYLSADSSVSFENCNVAARLNVYNDVCANYQYYWYRYCGMLIGTVAKTDSTGAALDLSNITANNCTVNFGTWNDYWYCELVHNSQASYTHDHQMSRLEQVSELPKNATGTRHFVKIYRDENGETIAECCHFIDGVLHEHNDSGTETVNGETVFKEDKVCVNIPFTQVFGGKGWGVKGTDIGDDSGIVVTGKTLGIVPGTQNKSVKKFDSTVTELANNTEYLIGDIFTENVKGTEYAEIIPASVVVGITDMNDTDGIVTAEFNADTDDWTKGTIEFEGVGKIQITIQDYFYCEPTTIEVEIKDREPEVKFEAKTELPEIVSGQTIAVGDLFAAKESFEDKIDVANVTVSVSSVDENSPVTVEYVADATDWTKGTLTFNGIGNAEVIITDNDYCIETKLPVNVEASDKFRAVFDSKPETPEVETSFVYRVGNQNTVALGSLFNAIALKDAEGTDLKDDAGNVIRKEINNAGVTIETIKGNASGKYTSNADWTKGTIKFEGTGIVKVTITDGDYCTPIELQLEVVNATNVAENGKIANYSTSSVLLGNTTVSTLYLNGGATLYGNGFTVDCTNSPVNGTGNVSENYIIGLAGANLDNVKIVGKVYTEYGAMASSNYNRALVISTGNSTITNCYLSNTAAPIRINSGNLTVKDSTVKGGNFANIDIRSGHLTLDNVTTINQAKGNDTAEDGTTVIGLGIVVYYEMVNTSATSITVKNGLTQYNYISSEDQFSNTYAQQFVNGMFNEANSALHYVINNIKWVNSGIILMTNGINVTGAGEKVDVSFMGATGAVYTTKPTQGNIDKEYTNNASTNQGVINPEVALDHDNEAKGNYIPKEAEKNDYCYFDGEKVLISMDKGDTFQYDPFILNATKLGQVLDYTVKLNGNAVEKGSKIAFTAAGEYTITYTYEDPYNYRLDENGALETFTVSYDKTDVVSVAIVEPAAAHAGFTFATNSTATEEILYNNNTYISAKGVTADGTTWGKITVGDKTIVYPIVTANVNRNKTSKECQVFYYVFNNVISITDANGTVYSHANGTGTDGKMPSNLKVIKGNELKVENNVFTSYNDANLSRTGGKIFCYSSSSQEDAPVAFNGALAYKSPSGLSYNGSRNYDAAVIVQYQFTDSNNATYYYYVGYKISNPNNGASGDGEDSECITPDTLITLANGKQVRVDSLTGNEELLVWNLETGKYDTTPIVFVDTEEEMEYEIIHLYFSDGSDVKVISEHGFFDLDLGKYVYIDAENYADYVGHRFVAEGKISANDWEIVTLDEVILEIEVTTAWSPVTFEHLCYYTNGVLSMPGGIEGLFNIFDVNTTTMRYDAKQMQKDIETYGLFTIEDFGGMITEDAFNAFNGAYLKVAMGKGLLTWEDIAYMAERYIPLM